jgi:hypothetical protein
MKAAKLVGIVVLVALGLVGVGLARWWAPDRPVESLTARWAPPQATGLAHSHRSRQLRKV